MNIRFAKTEDLPAIVEIYNQAIAILIETNHASIKLLEKYGFKKWGHMPLAAEFNGIELGHLYYGLRIG